MRKAIRALTLLGFGHSSLSDAEILTAPVQKTLRSRRSPVSRRISSLRCARGRAARSSKASMRVPAKKFVSSDSGQ